MQVVIDALHDELTHLGTSAVHLIRRSPTREMRKISKINHFFTLSDTVTRPRLVRRLARLEKRLKVPVDEAHICEVELRKAESVTIEGIRIHQTRQKSVTPITSFFSAHGASRSRSPSLSRQYSDEKVKRGPVGVHSVWLSKDGVEIGVEEVALEHYATMDYRGCARTIGTLLVVPFTDSILSFHSEGRIVRHIFLLLFWSIIFQPVEGAFETAYQVKGIMCFERCLADIAAVDCAPRHRP